MDAAWQDSASWRHRPPSGSSASGESIGVGGVAWKNPEDRRRERLNSELLSAILRMDVGKVQRLLNGDGPKPSVNAYCSETRATGLHIATMQRDEETLKVLLAAGADPSSRDGQGRLALHLAAWEGYIRTTKILFSADQTLIDAPVERQKSKWPPENSCGWGHDHNEVSNLIIASKTEEGCTPLHIAAMHCQKGVLDFLLEKGANVEATDALGRTPLDVAGQATGEPEQSTPYSPFTPTTYSAPVMPTTYSAPMATAYSAAMPAQYSAAAGPITTYSTPMDNNFIPRSFFMKPGSSLASSARSLADNKTPPAQSHAGDEETQAEIEQGRATPVPPPQVQPIGLDGLGHINTAIVNITLKLMSSGGRFRAPDSSETDSKDSGKCSGGLITAITSNNVDLMEILLKAGASLTAFDVDGNTPIHVAVRERKLEPLTVIIDWLQPGQIDMKNRDGLTALHLAVSSEWLAGVDYLLESQASVKEKTDNRGLTVYHMAAMQGNPRLMEELIKVEGWHEVINELDNEGYTPLFCAIEKASLMVVREIIKTGKVNVNARLPDGSNIIHFAVAKSSKEVLKFLVGLSSCVHLINEVTRAESGGMAPIHVAADAGSEGKTEILLKKGASPSLHTTHEPLGYVTALHLAAKRGYRRTIETILRFDSTCLQAEDKDGWTPLHTACSYGHGKSAVALVKAGADLNDKIDFHGTTKTALDLMVVNVPRCEELLEELLDSYIQVPDKMKHRGLKYINDPDCRIELNFQILLSSHDRCGRQLLFLNSIANTEEPKVRDILLHPLIEVFLHIKWSKMWKFFALLLFIYFVHTLTLTAFCAVIFIQHYNNVIWQMALQSTFLVTLVPIVVAETLQLLRLERRYWNDYESWIKWTMIFTSGTVGYGSLLAKDIEWIRHFSSFAILSSWIELLFLFSRFRYWGLDVLMFEKVIENVMTVLSKFVFLFLGFMFALMVHFEGAAPFSNFWDSFCQVIVMIVELNYGGVFSEASQNANAVIGRLVYVCYTLFVALAMINLTVGLAVSDVADLEKQGRVERLIKRTSFLSFLETLAYNERITRCFPPRPDKVGRNSFRSVNKTLDVYPNKPGAMPVRLKNALWMKIQEPERTESLTTEHFDQFVKEVNLKVDRMSKDIAKLQNPGVEHR